MGGRIMSEYSGFFNAQLVNDTYDRVYDAGDFSGYFSTFIGDGVFADPSNQLKIVPKSGLTVTLKAGKAFIEGYWYKLDEDMDFTLSANSSSYAINDLIVITLNKSTRAITAEKKENVNSMLPVNNGTVHELVVASIVVGVGASTITESNITDRRSDKNYCGFVTGLVKQIDVGELLTQFVSQFDDWFETIKGKLSEDVAGSLQIQIDDLSDSVDEKLNAIEVKLLSNTAIVKQKVTSTGGSYASFVVNMPDGFTSENCYVKSCMARMISGTGFSNGWIYGAEVSNLYSIGCNVNTDGTVLVMLQGSSKGINGDIEIMVAFERIGDENNE